MISIIIPTYNEVENFQVLTDRITTSLNKNEFEIIIVDDNSPDGTGELADKLSNNNDQISVIHRNSKNGLASAVVDGFLHAKGEIIGVMDADLSHPPEIIPMLILPIIENKTDFVIGSRYISEGETNDWSKKRQITSIAATLLARPLTDVKDPMSGLFFIKKEVIKDVKLNPLGYKIGLEIIVKGNYKNIMEIPFTFQNRMNGESKLGLKEELNYIHHLLKLYWYVMKKMFC